MGIGVLVVAVSGNSLMKRPRARQVVRGCIEVGLGTPRPTGQSGAEHEHLNKNHKQRGSDQDRQPRNRCGYKNISRAIEPNEAPRRSGTLDLDQPVSYEITPPGGRQTGNRRRKSMKMTFNQRHHGTLPPPRCGTPDLAHLTDCAGPPRHR